jgi:hypothetical protein
VRPFWPPAEPAQAAYEALRAAVLAGAPLADVAAARFARSGLAELIAHPVATPNLRAVVRGAARPAWAGHSDPRREALAAGYRLLLAAAEDHEQANDAEAAR